MMTRTLLSLTVLVTAAACGGGAAGVRTTSKFTDEHRRLFDDGIDLVSEPDKQPGRWGDDWRSDFRARMQMSDAIALGDVTTVHTDVDLDGLSSYRAVMGVDETARGPLPDQELVLHSRDGAIGYPTMHANRERVLDRRMVAFVKWYDGPDGIDAHWHMSPASQEVVAHVREMLEENRVVKRTVIERRDD